MQKVITYYLVDGGLIGICGSLPPPPGASAVVVSETPLGEWYPGTGLLERRDGLRTFRRLGDGREYTETIRGFYVRKRPDMSGRDVCLCCGMDTTGMRHGFDCAYCGGN